MIVNILAFVDWKDLLLLRCICLNWKKIVDSMVFKEKLKRESKKTLKQSFSNWQEENSVMKINAGAIPFYLYYAIGRKSFGTNLLKNGFGGGNTSHSCQKTRRGVFARGRFHRRNTNSIILCSDENCPKYKHWTVLQSGGNGWAVEVVPHGSEPLPAHLGETSCFVTSYGRCHKQQLITLAEHGLTTKIMDEVQPHIEVSEWYARRFDCGILYGLKVSLLDQDNEVVQEFSESKGPELTPEDYNWHQVSHTFMDYGPGVRSVLFEHSGIDTQFWAGHYGAKMAGGSVIARIPASLFQSD